jgi:predicted TIM-barrel fold metal-dependent hydrolase
MTVDVWMQHPTPRFLAHDMFDSLRRWTGQAIPETAPPLSLTIDALDAADIRIGLISAWSSPAGMLIANDEVAGWVAEHPDRLAGLAAVDLNRPVPAVRELRRCVTELGFKGLRLRPWLWEAPPTDRRYYPLYAACVELGVPFCTQVGHTGPLRASETGRPIPYIDQVALDFPELTIVCGHVGYPWTEEMVAVARKHPNVMIDTSAYTAKRLPRELVEYMRTGSGRHKVLFGSNWPMIAPAHALAELDSLELDDETRELYLGDNARRVFSLPCAGPNGAPGDSGAFDEQVATDGDA